MAVTASTRKADFEFMQELGRGSFAVVHKVRRKADKKVCVSKQVSLGSFLTPKQKAQALREAQIMKQLRSPHIVLYHDAFIEHGSLYLILQYCDRGDLKQFCASSRILPERTVWRIFLRVALGLEYLHSRKILHRDLKSENVFLTGPQNDQRIRIGDLGLAKMLTNSQTGASTLCGTPRYLSPEEISGAAHYSDKCDVWSLGVILYELLSDGHKGLFDDATRMPVLFRKICSEAPPTLPARTPEALKTINTLLLEKVPERRPTIAELLRLPSSQEAAVKHNVAEMQQCDVDADEVGLVEPRRNITGNRGTTPPPPGRSTSAAPAVSDVERATIHEVPDGPFARVCFSFRPNTRESPEGPRFHRKSFCEICAARGFADSNFTAFNRRHHCRSCGRTICTAHTAGSRPMPHLDLHTPQRFCELCRVTQTPTTGTPLPGGSRGAFVMAVTSQQKAICWDTRYVGRPCWTIGEKLHWAGSVSAGPGGEDALCVLEDGAAELRSFDAGGLLHRVPLSDLHERKGGSSAACGSSATSHAAAAARGPSAEITVAACSGSWLAVLQAEGGGAVCYVLDLPDGECLGHCSPCQGGGGGGGGAGMSIGQQPETVTALGLQQGSRGVDPFLVVGSSRGTVRVFGVPTSAAEKGGLCAQTCLLLGHGDAVVAVAIAGAGANFLCTGSKDGTLRLWRRQESAASAARFQANDPAVCDDFKASTGGTSICADGTLLAYTQTQRMGNWEVGASVWDLALGVWVRSFYKSGASVRCVALKGAWLATSMGAATVRQGCVVQLWNARTGVALSVVRSPALVLQLMLLEDTEQQAGPAASGGVSVVRGESAKISSAR